MRPSKVRVVARTSGSIGTAAFSGVKGCLDRDVDQREHSRRLQPAILVDFEVLARQVLDERALLVGDDGMDLDEVRFGPEGHGRLLFRRRRLRRLVRRRGRRRRLLRREDGLRE